MSEELQEIEKLEQEVKKLKDTLAYYSKLYAEDGVIDETEQIKIDAMNAIIQKIEVAVKAKVKDLSFGKKIIHAASNIVEDVVDVVEDVVHAIKDKITGEDHKEHVGKMPDVKEETSKEEKPEEETSKEEKPKEDTAKEEEKEEKQVEKALSTTSKISASVGHKGKNKPEDVILVKTLLNKYGNSFALEPQDVAVVADTKLTEAIKKFQQDYRGSTKPDGRVDANGGTWGSLLGIARIKGDLLKVAKEYGVEPAVILAIQSIESGGNGFLSDGRPKILFEGHIFWSQLKKAGKDPAALQKGNENIIYPKWVKTHYVGGAGEYDRLEKAKKIDKLAALKSASWGEFQIMGFNHSVAGYGDVETFVTAMHEAGSNQLGGLMSYLKGNNLIRHVQGDKKDWAALAKGYNGPAYAENKYDIKLAAAYDRYAKLNL
jgi:hypothetical protein